MSGTPPAFVIEDWGGEGPVILLLHAFPLSSRMWEGQREALTPIGRLLLVDYPGFGKSPPPQAAVSLEAFAAEILSELRKRNLSGVSAVGLSMGGYLLFELLRQDAGMFERIVLADTRPGTDTFEGKKQREVVATRAERGGVAHLPDTIPRLLGPHPTAAVKRVVRELMLGATPQGVAAASRAMANRRDQTALLPTLSAPTLIVVGSDDLVTPLDESRRMSEEIPGAQLRVLAGVGHLSNLEAPERFNRALVSFLGGQR